MDWRELTLKAAGRITDENWIQGCMWQMRSEKPDNAYGMDYEGSLPSKACAIGHLYWSAKVQGLPFDEAGDLVVNVVSRFQDDAGIHGWDAMEQYNDTAGRTATEVAEVLRVAATT